MPFSLKLRVAAGVDPSGVPPPLFPPRVFHAYLSTLDSPSLVA